MKSFSLFIACLVALELIPVSPGATAQCVAIGGIGEQFATGPCICLKNGETGCTASSNEQGNVGKCV